MRNIMSVCFVILRHVDNAYFDRYWIEAYKSIRKFYKDTPIKIIDTGSTCASTIPTENCDIIQAEYSGSRLFAPYYELLKLEDYSKAIVIHDGLIFNRYIDFSEYPPVKFLWHFETHDYDNDALITKQIEALENHEDALNLYKSKAWYGCLGCLMVIDKSFLDGLEEKYKLKRLINIINNKDDAIAFERTVAVLCYQEYPVLKDEPSIEGDIRNMIWGYRYEDFMNNPSAQDGKPFFKLFGAR